MEAYTNLLRMWPDAGLRQALAGLVEVMLTRVVNPATGHLGLFFADDWTLRSDQISYGHDIEAAWLLIFGELHSPAQLARFSAMLTENEMIHEGMRHFFEGFPPGSHPMAALSAMSARTPTRNGGRRPRRSSASSTPARFPARNASSPPRCARGSSSRPA